MKQTSRSSYLASTRLEKAFCGRKPFSWLIIYLYTYIRRLIHWKDSEKHLDTQFFSKTFSFLKRVWNDYNIILLSQRMHITYFNIHYFRFVFIQLLVFIQRFWVFNHWSFQADLEGLRMDLPSESFTDTLAKSLHDNLHFIAHLYLMSLF